MGGKSSNRSEIYSTSELSNESTAHTKPVPGEPECRTVAVVILNYNNAHDTIGCVESLLLSSLRRQPVIVLDNGSNNRDISLIETALNDSIRMLKMEKNVGVASGWNIAIKYALESHKPDFIFLLNNDTTMEGSVIDELLGFVDSLERVGAAGPSIMRYDHRSEHQYPRHRGIVDPVRDRRLSGCALLIRREVFDDVGFFDDEYFAYAEEYDFLERMNKAGWNSYYVPTDAKVYHKGARTSSSISGFEAFHRTRNRLLFAGKNLNGFELLAYLGSFLLRTLPADIYHDMGSPDRAMRLRSRVRGFAEGTRLFIRYRTRSRKAKGH